MIVGIRNNVMILNYWIATATTIAEQIYQRIRGLTVVLLAVGRKADPLPKRKQPHAGNVLKKRGADPNPGPLCRGSAARCVGLPMALH